MSERKVPDRTAFEVMAVFEGGKLAGLYAKATDSVGMRPHLVDIVPMLRELINKAAITD